MLRLAFPVLGDLRANIREGEARFHQADADLGWTLKPGAAGTFTNGIYRGTVHITADGIRRNGDNASWDPLAPAVFMIGDSNTAGFEVDDHQSVPAHLERGLREAGRAVNVLNLGVRGYGMDQAVRRALAFRTLDPEVVLYLFTNNDFWDATALKFPNRPFGKGRRRTPTSSTPEQPRTARGGSSRRAAGCWRSRGWDRTWPRRAAGRTRRQS
jgi:hypothetical protein